MRIYGPCLALFGTVLLVSPTQADAQSADSAYKAAFDAQKYGEYDAAAPLYQQACTGNIAKGCQHLGDLYDHGLGVTKDEVRATGLCQQACTGGDPWGCYRLGDHYRDGRGVAKNTEQTLRLYCRALALNPDTILIAQVRSQINRLSTAPRRHK